MDNMDNDVKVQNPNNDTVTDTDGKEEKTFTQEEVNKIISERLARERSKAEPQVDEREKALQARESRMDCRDYIYEKKYPNGLLEIFNTDDVESFKKSVEKLTQLFPEILPEKKAKLPQFSCGSHYISGIPRDDISEAFKPPKI